MPAAPSSPRIARERRTVKAMIGIYCRKHHGTTTDLCADCAELLDYANRRLECCPFGAEKPTCAKCPIHCYTPQLREKIKTVMSYAGPRMLWRHPWLAIRHLLDGLRKPPERAPRK
jgi:hypothetical protein